MEKKKINYKKVWKTCKLEECNHRFLGHPNRKFCCTKHKDKYHNRHNPRGFGLVDPRCGARHTEPETAEEAYERDLEHYYATSSFNDSDALGQD